MQEMVVYSDHLIMERLGNGVVGDYLVISKCSLSQNTIILFMPPFMVMVYTFLPTMADPGNRLILALKIKPSTLYLLIESIFLRGILKEVCIIPIIMELLGWIELLE